MYNDLSPRSEVPVPLECRMFAICIAITMICTALAHRADYSWNRVQMPVCVATGPDKDLRGRGFALADDLSHN